MRTLDIFEPVYQVNSLGITELDYDGDGRFTMTIIPFTLIQEAVLQAEGDSSVFWKVVYKRAFMEIINEKDKKYADIQREYLDESEFPFENLTLRQLVNLATAYKKSA